MSSIILITPTPPDISAFGIRSLSAFLRQRGHRTRLVFLPGSAGMLTESGSFAYRYKPSVIQDIIDLSRGFNYIGLSFMTYYLDRAVQITRSLQATMKTPVIWGGIHASCKPEEALAVADMVCVGEGEDALTSLLDGDADIPGIWRKRDGRVIRNGPGILAASLDSLPFCDFSNTDHFVHDPEYHHVVPLTDDRLMAMFPRLPYFGDKPRIAFRIMADRGCPHRCQYCNVPFIKKMYEEVGSSYFRNRSVDHVIDELDDIHRRFPRIGAIQFFDDTFFAKPLSWMRSFAEAFRKRIGLPFYCQASPTTLTQEKLDLLVDAGLVYVEMGIQTGSPKMRRIYNRVESSGQIRDSARLIHSRMPKLMPPDYHVIVDSPWETHADILETVRLLHQLPKPFGLAISSLVLFPETGLYNQALADGLIRDEWKEIFRRPFYIAPQRSFAHFLLYLMTFQHVPKRVVDILLKNRTIRLAEKWNPSICYKAFYVIGEIIRLIAKGITALRNHDYDRFITYFKRRRTHDPVVAGRKS